MVSVSAWAFQLQSHWQNEWCLLFYDQFLPRSANECKSVGYDDADLIMLDKTLIAVEWIKSIRAKELFYMTTLKNFNAISWKG